MKTASHPGAEPRFGKVLAVFLTVFALVFGPCLPVAPFGALYGVQQLAAADHNITTNITTRVNQTNDHVIVTDGGSVNVSNSSPSENGGGISAAQVTINGTGSVNFTNNNATSSGGATSKGGAIYANGDVTLSGTGTNTFTNNSATHYGGAIHVNTGTVTLSGGTNNFTNNNASNSSTFGGAIHVDTGNVTLSGGTNTFTSNRADYGGAIYAGNVTLSGGNNTFTSNSATFGGAIYAGNVTLSDGNNTFTGNKATSGGGAIYAGTVTLSGNATFDGNNATSRGGAIYANKGNIYLIPDASNSIVFKNASDTLATGNATAWLHIGGAGNTTFEDGFNNPNLTVVHFGTNNYTAYNASAGWANNTSITVTQNTTEAFGTASSGWANTTGSGRATPFSAVTGNFVLGNDQILSLDMNVANSTKVPYFTVNNGNVTSGSNTTLYGVIGGNLTSAAIESNYTYAIFNVTNGSATGFNFANYRTSNRLVEFADPTFYGNASGGTFTVGVKRIESPFNGIIDSAYNKTVNHGTTNNTTNQAWSGDVVVTRASFY